MPRELWIGDTTLSGDQWNREVLPALQGREVLAGANIEVQHHPQGTLVSLGGGAEWAHPWKTTVSYDRAKKTWLARTLAGFVNGQDPLAQVPVDGEKTEAIGLLDDPAFPLPSFRDEAASFPQFFEMLGVKKPRNNLIIGDEGVSIDTTERNEDGAKPRFLKVCECWLAVARPTLRMDATVTGNILVGSIVDYSLTYDTATLETLGARARIETGARMPVPYEPSFSERLQGQFIDDGADRIKVFTAWFLSPPEAEVLPGPPPDDWTPYIQHHLFWNLSHAVPPRPPRTVRQTPLDPASAWLVGRYTAAPAATYAAFQAEAQRALLAAFNSIPARGYFWTA